MKGNFQLRIPQPCHEDWGGMRPDGAGRFCGACAKTVVDTLAAVGLAPKRELEVYPNPARRGTVVSLRWQRTDPGAYEVDLFSAAGELVRRRKIEVGGKEQVDLLGLPAALPAGMYFLRAARPDGAKVITLRIMLV